MNKHLVSIVASTALGLVAGAASGATLDDVKAKGFVQCGVNTGLPGFANPDDAGNWTGLDIDYCKAIAAAVFGDVTKVKYTPLSAKDRFTALQSGEIDLLARNSTWTITRDTSLGLSFVGVNYYDGQGFEVKKSLGVTSALELGGASVCVQSGTTTELNLADWFKANNLEFTPVVFEKVDEVNAAYESGRCDVFTTDASGLYAYRLTFQNPDDHMVLPEIISKEPLGPLVRQGDAQWFNIVKWTHFALLESEEYGITQANVEEMKASESPTIKRILGADDSKIGEGLGLTNDWVVNIIKGVGNYGEIFDRNVGAGSPLKIERGLNALWSKGGLQYAPPIR
jgi:general L-amino acid transport system substrate-binding protein